MATAKILGISLMLVIASLQTILAMEQEEATSEKGATSCKSQSKWTLITGPITKMDEPACSLGKIVRYSAQVHGNGQVQALKITKTANENIFARQAEEQITGYYTWDSNPEAGPDDAKNPPYIEFLSEQEEKELFNFLEAAFEKQEQSKEQKQE